MRTEYLSVTLPHPPGINRTYRAGKGRVYMTDAAAHWAQDALLLLRAAGFRPKQHGCYWIDVLAILRTVATDVDAPSKIILDTLAKSLDIDDRWVARLAIVKVPASRAQQCVELHVTIEPVKDAAAWAERSYRVLDGLSSQSLYT